MKKLILIILVLVPFILFAEPTHQKKVNEATNDVRSILIYADSFMVELNKSVVAKELAVFLFRFYVELKSSGFTEDQALSLLQMSGNTIYDHAKRKQ